MDVVRSYIPVAPEGIEQTAVVTFFGLLDFSCMPLGLRNAAQTFQRFMHHILRGLDFVFVYKVGVLAAS